MELKVSGDGDFTSSELLATARIFVGWAISFIMIATIWFDNHTHLTRVTHVSTSMAVVTMVQLALLSLIPFASNLIVDYPDVLWCAVVFNLLLLAIGLCSAVLALLVAAKPSLLLDPSRAAASRMRGRFLIQAYVAVAIIGTVGAVTNHPFSGVLLWLLAPLAVWLRARNLPAGH